MRRGNIMEMIILWLLLLLVAWVGDRLVNYYVATLPPKSVLRASDTVIHGLIAAVSWRLVSLMKPQLQFDVCLPLRQDTYHCLKDRENSGFFSFSSWFNMEIAFVLASLVDLDHIIMDLIKSWQGITQPYWQRGWFHYVLPPLLFVLVMYISSLVFKSLHCVRIGSLVFICVIGHQVRDALHHGLWLQPLGVTPQFPYFLYIILTMLFPFITVAISSLLMLRLPPVQSIPDIIV